MEENSPEQISKSIKHQKRSNTPVLIIGAIVIFLLGTLSGYLVKDKSNQNPVNHSIYASSTPLPSKIIPTQKLTWSQNKLILKELGITMQMPDGLQDAEYTMRGNYADFSTKSLTVMDENCSAYHAALGLVEKVDKAQLQEGGSDGYINKDSIKQMIVDQPNPYYPEGRVAASAKEFPTFYIVYVRSQAACASSKNFEEIKKMQLDQSELLRQAVLTSELIK